MEKKRKRERRGEDGEVEERGARGGRVGGGREVACPRTLQRSWFDSFEQDRKFALRSPADVRSIGASPIVF